MNIPNNILAILARAGILKHLNLQWRVSVDHNPVVIPILGHWGLSHLWLSEQWMLTVLRALRTIRTGPFVDVGVNQGQTLLKAKAIDTELVYFGFEPDPHCVYYVRELIRFNGYKNCSIVPVGLSDKTELSVLYSAGDGDSAASILQNFRDLNPGTIQQNVPVFSFDQLVEPLSISDIAVFKVDVEGSELEVLEGAEKALARYRPFILCEILPVYDDTTINGQFRKTRQVTVEKMLRDLRYRIGRVDHESGKVALLDSIETHSNLDACDYVCIPEESLEQVKKILCS